MPAKQHAFVVMSFDPMNDALYAKAIRPAIESLGIRSLRVDQEHFQNKISEHILERIKNSYFVVADLSHERPNCYYELGYAHAMKKPVVLLIDDPKKIHFDIYDFQFLIYSSASQLRKQLREKILNLVLTNHAAASDDDYRCGKFGRVAVKGGRLLTAEITPARKTLCDITLRVQQIQGGRPLKGKVRFYLHDTYEPASYTIEAYDSVAELEINAKGPFTVGAKCDNDRTLLELNLATLPAGTPNFYRG